MQDDNRRHDSPSPPAPAHAWADLLARERAAGFEHLRGTRAEIAIPIHQALVDRLVAQALAGRDATIVRIDLLEGARIGVEVTHRVLGIPARARTTLELDREVDLRHYRVVLRHDDSLLWRTIRPVVATLGLLPAGVAFGSGTVEVDLRAAAARGGWADALPFLRRLVIHGPADGLFALEADVEIGEPTPPGPTSPEPTAGPASGARLPALPIDELLAALAGSRARVDLHVAEALVNEAITRARALAARPLSSKASGRAIDWVSFVRHTEVHFEPGRAVLFLDLEIPDTAAVPAREGA